MSPNLLYKETGRRPTHGESLAHTKSENEYLQRKSKTSQEYVSCVRVTPSNPFRATLNEESMSNIYNLYGTGNRQKMSTLPGETVHNRFSDVPALYIIMNEPTPKADYTQEMNDFESLFQKIYTDQELYFCDSHWNRSDINGEILIKRGRIVAVMVKNKEVYEWWPENVLRFSEEHELMEFINGSECQLTLGTRADEQIEKLCDKMMEGENQQNANLILKMFSDADVDFMQINSKYCVKRTFREPILTKSQEPAMKTLEEYRGLSRQLLKTLFHTGVTRKGLDGSLWKVKEDKNGTKRWYLHVAPARKATKVRRSQTKPSGPRRDKYVLKVHAFHVNDDPRAASYVGRGVSSKRDIDAVTKLIYKNMEGFRNVSVTHERQNVFTITSDGPDEDTSPELRNLAQMADDAPFTVKPLPGFDFFM
jgi:hypothetical protein